MPNRRSGRKEWPCSTIRMPCVRCHWNTFLVWSITVFRANSSKRSAITLSIHSGHSLKSSDRRRRSLAVRAFRERDQDFLRHGSIFFIGIYFVPGEALWVTYSSPGYVANVVRTNGYHGNLIPSPGFAPSARALTGIGLERPNLIRKGGLPNESRGITTAWVCSTANIC